MFRVYLSLVVLFTTLYSCRERVKDKDIDVPTLDFGLSQRENPEEILTVDYIKLETNELCFIDKVIVQLESAQGRLFVLSGGADRSLLVFDMEGSFLQKVGSIGNGPGEFVVPSSFSINPSSGIISVVDIAQQKIVDYSLDRFDFISERRMEFYNACFEYTEDGRLLFRNTDAHSAFKEWGFLLTDSNLHVADQFVKKEFATGYLTGHVKTIYRKNGHVYAYAQYEPLLYRYQDQLLSPVYQLKFGKVEFPPLDYLNKISADNNNFLAELETSQYIHNYCIFDTPEIFSIYYAAAQKPYIGLYDKEKEKTYGFTKAQFEEQMKIGTMDRPMGTIGGFVVATLQPFDLRERLENGYEFDPALAALIEISEDDDNPILFLYKFKD